MPKIVDREEMRGDLTLACFDLFARKGYAAVTMRDLARELRVSTGMLYHYFSSKSDLFNQMLRRLVAQDIEEALARMAEAARPTHRMQVLIDYIAEREEHFKRVLFLVFECNPQLDQQHADTFRELLEVYRNAITESLGVGDPRAGHMVMSVVVGTLVQRVVDPQSASLDEARSFLQETLTTVMPARA